MCIRLSCGSQMLLPAKRVTATTCRRDSHEVVKLCLRLIAEKDARSVGDHSHPSYRPMFMQQEHQLQQRQCNIVTICLRNQTNPHVFVIEHVNDYTLIRFEIPFEFESQPPIRFVIRFERKYPIRRSLLQSVDHSQNIRILVTSPSTQQHLVLHFRH